MRPLRVSTTRRPWKAPTVTKLAIGTETKSNRENERILGSESAVSSQPRSAHPQPPAAPATKLGFAFEWAFPLSTRTH
jgi:hypothetical protein